MLYWYVVFAVIPLSKFVLQLRQTVFQFVQKELAPKAAEIDRENTFREMRVSINL